jgi:hypothetical protein
MISKNAELYTNFKFVKIVHPAETTSNKNVSLFMHYSICVSSKVKKN